jgi:tripartite ATP-independent transporter DctM subunit
LAGFTLVAVPLFILMGEIIFVSGIGADIYVATSRWLNRMPGSLGMSSVAACAIFSALCGVSLAGAATIGSFAIPEMLKRGYDKSLATGCVAASGGLALLIPPSVALILYGVVGDESVGKLFIGGIIPGILLAALMMGYIFVLANIRPHMAPRSEDQITWGMRFAALANIWPVLALIVLVLGSIYAGIATPTEAAAVGCIGAFVVGFFRKRLNWTLIKSIFRSAMLTSGMIMLIFSAALLFGYTLTRLQVPQQLAQLVANAHLPNWAVLTLIFALLYLMGMFMDIVSVILISTPILLPIVIGMGYSSLWFGVVMAIACEIGTETPPVGLNLFVIKGVSPPSVRLIDIIRGSIPFAFVETCGLIICILFPGLILWLPGLLG